MEWLENLPLQGWNRDGTGEVFGSRKGAILTEAQRKSEVLLALVSIQWCILGCFQGQGENCKDRRM
ncbi:hypothetical protein Q7O60_02160 [Pseudomonas protegens]|uniref:hypothetical protein n=1 Tax=Pseudomonas protegens TaxID=380021 RepID=UPI002773145F|nr:hypothetical protein [Pseudomonas protegens]MDP9501789.1 hypothetical protein [Pseudomonas protegens]